MMSSASVIGSCPDFTPVAYSRRKRELRCRISAQNGDNATQLVAKIISISHRPGKINGLSDLGKTEFDHTQREIEDMVATLDQSYGRTETEKRGGG